MSTNALHAAAPSPTALVLLNAAAAGGRGAERWAAVEPAVHAAVTAEVVAFRGSAALDAALHDALQAGVRTFVAAGGDGTVGTLVDALVRVRGRLPLGSLTLGAVGLGSSNDFHKPFRSVVAGIPLRLGPEHLPHDICRARFVAADGALHERHFVVSASLGIVARANAFFSAGDGLQDWLRARWTEGAILHAGVRTLACHANDRAVLQMSDAPAFTCALTNLSIAKTPWVSGAFRYDTPAAADDGMLAVNLCEGMGRFRALRTLADLARGRFAGGRGRHHWQAARLDVELDATSVLELDGETFRARRVVLDVLPERIGVLT